MERRLYIETINQVKKFIDEKDYEGLKIYIEKRQKETMNDQEENKVSDYIDSLIDELK